MGHAIAGSLGLSYRLVWAPADQDFLSWRAPNEALRGNDYPDGSATSLTLTGLTEGIEFKAGMRARYRTGEYADARWSGPWTATVTITVSSTPEPTPAATPEPTPEPTEEPTPTPTETPPVTPGPGEITTFEVAANGIGSISLDWDVPTPEPDRYQIHWGESHLPFPPLADRNFNVYWEHGASLTLGDTIVDPGKTYKLRVRADYTTGDGAPWQGPWSGTAIQRVLNSPPAAPGELTVTSASHDGVGLSWSAPSHDALTGYKILRGAGDGALATLIELDQSALTHTDTTTEDDTAYRYAVVALSLDGDSPQSSEISATTPPRTPEVPDIEGMPARPTGLTASLDGEGGVSLAWTGPADAEVTGYRVLRGVDADSLVVVVEDTGASGATHTTMPWSLPRWLAATASTTPMRCVPEGRRSPWAARSRHPPPWAPSCAASVGATSANWTG